jgi:hypothetical protein
MVYGMNLDHMPEPQGLAGYPVRSQVDAVRLAWVGPYVVFKRRDNWL